MEQQQIPDPNEFEGMTIKAFDTRLRGGTVSGVKSLRLGERVRVEVLGIVVEAHHKYDEKIDGGRRTQFLKVESAKATKVV